MTAMLMLAALTNLAAGFVDAMQAIQEQDKSALVIIIIIIIIIIMYNTFITLLCNPKVEFSLVKVIATKKNSLKNSSPLDII